jgi:hypothetical protein
VLHEMGHVLGLGRDEDSVDLMTDVLQAGQRRWPTPALADVVLVRGNWLE